MKLLFILCIFITVINPLAAQVGIGTATPNPKAILELNTTDKGLLPPRLTTAQRNSIGAAAAEDGMIVFDTDLDSLMIYQAATNTWHSIAFTTIGSTAWNLNGNAGTNPATHYIGTSDAQSLVIKTSGIERMHISAAGNIGIGTPTPSARLHIASNASPAFRLVDGTEGAGKVLVSDAAGNASWQTPVSNDWGLTGNTGTNPATHYIGTSDAQSLRFKVNNQFSGLIEYAASDGNTAFGYNTMANPTAGGAIRNVAIGDGVLGSLTTGDDNTGIGYRALENNNTGNSNVAVGARALHANTGGFANTATGWGAMRFNTTGYNNVAAGINALANNTTGHSNVANGRSALYANTSGHSNVAAGRDALYNNTTGWGNVAAGRDALYGNTIGSRNTAVGDSAGLTNTNGTRNTYLGYLADANANNYTNSTAIGANARVDASNSMVLGSINGINGATANTNVGIRTTIPNTALDIAGDLALRATPMILPAAGLLHNYDLNTNRASLYRITNVGGAVTFTGFTGGVDGRIVTLHNNSGSNITLNNLDAGSAVGNRILTGTGLPVTIANNGTVTLQYDAVNTRWFVVSIHEGGLPVANLAWNLTGNTGTNPATHYIGTSDAQSLRFKVNNQFSGLIEYAAADGNTAFGYKTMANPTASGALRNVAFGDGVLGALTNGDDNTGIGYRALENNTTGSQNVAAGTGALRSNNTGWQNTATGNQVLFLNTGGSFNTATGARALTNNTTGNNNVATGFNALYFNNIGSSNVATGRNALYANVTGWQNTAVGDSAGYTNATGTGNTYVGYRADANANNYTNSTAIGHQAVVRASNSMMFGNTNVTNWSFGRNTAPGFGKAMEVGTTAANGNGAYLTSAGVWTIISDRNLKTNITNLSGAEILAKIGQLPVTRWTYKGTNETHIGPMAQDFYRLFNVGLDSVSISTVDPGGVALIGIQELKRQVESLQSENSALKKEVENLHRQNAQQQQENAMLKALNTKFEARLKLLEDRAGIKAEK